MQDSFCLSSSESEEEDRCKQPGLTESNKKPQPVAQRYFNEIKINEPNLNGKSMFVDYKFYDKLQNNTFISQVDISTNLPEELVAEILDDLVADIISKSLI